MSHFLDRLKFFSKPAEPFSNGHGTVVDEDRTWENAYRCLLYTSDAADE